MNLRIAATALLAASLLCGQEIAFEVASIKPSTDKPPAPGMILAPTITVNATQVTYRNVQLATLISRAFQLRRGEFAASNKLDPKIQFDIVANLPPGATPNQIPLMEQHLLRERFGLRVHREPRTQEVFIVRLGKDGPKFKESPPPPPPADPDVPKRASLGLDDQGFPIPSPDYSGIVMMPGGGRMALSAQRVEMSRLLHAMEDYLRRPTVDQTGLTALYDFRVQFLFGGRTGALPNEPIPTARDAIALLGLTLEEAEAPIESLIIDAINTTPTDN